MIIDFTELEIEKKARIEAQLGLLQEQANRLNDERNLLIQSILERGEVDTGSTVTIFQAYAEVVAPVSDDAE